MENIPTYCEVKNGRGRSRSIHPSIDHILDETQGIIVYQEQVMEIAQVMAGYSLGGADLLRRAMGKKIAEEMAKEKPKFIAGAIANGVTKEKAGRSSTFWRSSPTTASTSPTPRPTPSSATRPPGSRRTTRSSSWRAS
jgi:DNA polymerase III alpha subunit